MDVPRSTAVRAVVNACGNAVVFVVVVVVVARAQLMRMVTSSSLQCGAMSVSVHLTAACERTDKAIVPTAAISTPNLSAKFHETSFGQPPC